MGGADGPAIDLDAYLARIGYAGGRRPGAATLRAVHRAHATHIPFENLDVRLGRPVRLDPEGLQAKLVRSRRGGYCFEQNALLAAALEQLGFAVTRLAARVRFGAREVRPRTHMALLVEAGGSTWLADVGFGGQGPILPVPFRAGTTRQFGWPYRLAREGASWVLHATLAGAWLEFYAFTLEPQLPVDYEPANHYVATHPDSPFRHTIMAHLATPEARYVLRDRDLAVCRPGGRETRRRLATDAELYAALAGEFGLDPPPGLTLPPEPVA